MVAPDAKREAVAHVVAVHGVSQRRACEVLAVDRSSIRYRSVRPDDAVERAEMKAVAVERRRFGYRRIHIMLERQGITMNLKTLRRLYREEHLQVRKRGGRKRALGTRRPMAVPQAANDRWSLDFISDECTSIGGVSIIDVELANDQFQLHGAAHDGSVGNRRYSVKSKFI